MALNLGPDHSITGLLGCLSVTVRNDALALSPEPDPGGSGAREQNGQRSAVAVDRGMDLRAQPSAGTSSLSAIGKVVSTEPKR
jgi:hypothetical protein